MRVILHYRDTERHAEERAGIVGIDTVASRNGTTITRARYLDHEAKVLSARHIFLSNTEAHSAGSLTREAL